MKHIEHTEPEYIIVQRGLGGVAWLGEIIDGEPSPIGKVADILDDAHAHDKARTEGDMRTCRCRGIAQQVCDECQASRTTAPDAGVGTVAKTAERAVINREDLRALAIELGRHAPRWRDPAATSRLMNRVYEVLTDVVKHEQYDCPHQGGKMLNCALCAGVSS